MLVMCYELFSQRKDILSAWQRKFRYILVDEFQDINRIQYEIVKMLALPENNLFIVGDDDQSIYRFRGAKPEIMLGFEKDYPGARRVLLAENYRSSREIVEASLKLISRNQVRFKKELVPVHGPGRPVDVSVYENPLAEAEGTARRIRQYAQAGFAFEDMAVLFRTGNGTGLLAEKLMEYNIPFSMRDVIPSLYGHWIAKDLMAYLELGHGSRARSDFFRIMNRPNRYFSRDAFETPLVSLDQVRDFYRDRDWMQERVMDLEGDLRTIGRLRPGPAIHYIRQAVGYDDYLKEFAAFRRIRPEEFFDIASQIEESAAGFSTLEQWKEHIRQYEETLKEKRREAKEPGRPEGVTLSTMHSSKGLEYRIVCQRGHRPPPQGGASGRHRGGAASLLCGHDPGEGAAPSLRGEGTVSQKAGDLPVREGMHGLRSRMDRTVYGRRRDSRWHWCIFTAETERERPARLWEWLSGPPDVGLRW